MIHLGPGPRREPAGGWMAWASLSDFFRGGERLGKGRHREKWTTAIKERGLDYTER